MEGYINPPSNLVLILDEAYVWNREDIHTLAKTPVYPNRIQSDIYVCIERIDFVFPRVGNKEWTRSDVSFSFCWVCLDDNGKKRNVYNPTPLGDSSPIPLYWMDSYKEIDIN